MRERITALFNDMLARTPVELVSKLDRAEVVRRLKAAIDGEWWPVYGGKPVRGLVGATTFRLRWRNNYRNSFQTVLFGTLADEGRGTRIHARTGMHPFVAVFMALWLSGVGFGATIAISGAIAAEPGEPVQGQLVFVPIGMFVFGIALVGMGRWFARHERARLIEFLERTVDGKRAS